MKNWFQLTQVFHDGGTFCQTAHNRKYKNEHWTDQLHFMVEKLNQNMSQLKFATLYYQGRKADHPDHTLLQVRNSKLTYVNDFFHQMIAKANGELALRNKNKGFKKIEFEPYKHQSK